MNQVTGSKFSFFFLFSPIVVYKVTGNSMLPNFSSGKKILVQKKWFICNLKENDSIVLKDPRNKRLILKRIQKIKGNSYYVIGDNPTESTDSRVFGWVNKDDIIGKVISIS